jgi:hypothetical protein
MRGGFLAALGALAIAMAAPVGANAAPAGGQSAIDRTTAGASYLEEARYVVRCHRVRVRRDTPEGPQRVWVRRCHRVQVPD